MKQADSLRRCLAVVICCIAFGGSMSAQTVAPTFSKAFGAPTIPVGGTTTLAFTLTNPNTVGLTGVAFTDTLPAGLTIPGPFTFAPFCGGTGSVVGAVGPPATITMSGNSLPAGATCVVDVTVQGTAGGTKNNTTSTLTSNEAPAAPAATASIYVIAAPTFSNLRAPASPWRHDDPGVHPYQSKHRWTNRRRVHRHPSRRADYTRALYVCALLRRHWLGCGRRGPSLHDNHVR